jgi:hypothetical protein
MATEHFRAIYIFFELKEDKPNYILFPMITFAKFLWLSPNCILRESKWNDSVQNNGKNRVYAAYHIEREGLRSQDFYVTHVIDPTFGAAVSMDSGVSQDL